MKGIALNPVIYFLKKEHHYPTCHLASDLKSMAMGKSNLLIPWPIESIPEVEVIRQGFALESTLPTEVMRFHSFFASLSVRIQVIQKGRAKKLGYPCLSHDWGAPTPPTTTTSSGAAGWSVPRHLVTTMQSCVTPKVWSTRACWREPPRPSEILY